MSEQLLWSEEDGAFSSLAPLQIALFLLDGAV